MGKNGNIDIYPDRVVLNNFEIKDSALAEYLGTVEDPESEIRDLIDISMTMRSRFNTDLETQNIKASADAVIEKIETTYKAFIKELEEEAKKLVDPKDGPVVKALEKAAEGSFTKLLNPEFDPESPSPISRLKSALSEEIDEFKDDIEETLREIKTKLGIGAKTRKTAADGTDFEASVDSVIQNLAKIYGDTAISIGAQPGIAGSKKGDTLVTLNFDDTQSQRCEIVWESKTEAKFKGDPKTKSPKVIDDQVKIELNKAINTQSANAGILVLDSAGLDMDAQPVWREYEGNKLLVVVDPNVVDEDLIRLAYLWGRWKARSSIGKLESTIDSDGIRDTIETLRLRLKELRKVKLHHTASIDAINSADLLLKSFRKDAKSMMEDLAGMVNIKLADDPDGDD